jgi:hypothetical protein
MRVVGFVVVYLLKNEFLSRGGEGGGFGRGMQQLVVLHMQNKEILFMLGCVCFGVYYSRRFVLCCCRCHCCCQSLQETKSWRNNIEKQER